VIDQLHSWMIQNQPWYGSRSGPTVSGSYQPKPGQISSEAGQGKWALLVGARTVWKLYLFVPSWSWWKPELGRYPNDAQPGAAALPGPLGPKRRSEPLREQGRGRSRA